MFERGELQCKIAFVHIILALTTEAVVANLFTSIHDMEALAHQEHRLLHTVHNYISTQQARLSLLSTKLEQLAKVRPSEQTVEDLISDPINAYSLVRRLTREWPLILNLMVHYVDIQEELTRLPKEDDMESAVIGLTRLQDVYRLDTRQLAQQSRGIAHLTALDCFEIGKYLFKSQKYKVTESWFKEALNKIGNEDLTVEQDKILPHLFLASLHSECKNGTGSGGATNVLQYLMSHYPNYTLDKESAPLFRQAFSANCPRLESLNKSADAEPSAKFERIYSEACRGNSVHSSSELRCYYIRYNNPRLLITPFKMEEQNLNPPILMFHDVISDQEIKEMKAAFKKVRKRCSIGGGDELNRIEKYRTCDVGWVEDNATDVSARLTRRMGDITNLAMETSEENQVASYGLAGEYKLHFDTRSLENLTNSIVGGRIATLMFYLSDVESGGYTVFPFVNVAVKPVKGSAVFWFNMDHRSLPLEDMRHGGCAVLRGSKWVMNKWIHEAKQTSEMFCPIDEIFPRPRYYLNGVK